MTFAYLTVLSLLFLGSLYKLGLVILFFARRPRAFPPPLPRGKPPFVTVQLPLYNERFVADGLLKSVAALDYPRELLEIQVLDDSTDETSLIVERWAGEIPLVHRRREARTDYKAGALAEGLRTAKGELIAIFDADFRPEPDFLMRIVPYFRDDEVGMVQARWGYLNATESLLTRLQALYLNAHFRIEHAVRARVGAFFHFNGSAGVWRKAAIESAGGWRGKTVTEDLDLSYRAHLAGWRFVFLDDVEAPSELPSTVPAFQAQQFRWTKGMAQVARQLLPTIWRAPVASWKKIDATFHLLSPFTYLSTLAGALGLVPYLLWRAGGELSSLETLLAALLSSSLVWNATYFLISESANGTLSPRRLVDVAAGIPMGIALSVNGTKALFEGLRRDGGAFVRTPKKGDGAVSRRRYEALSPASLPWEFLLGVAFLFAFFAAPSVLIVMLGSGFWYLSFAALQRIYARTLARA